jgi:hypothetical protein
MPDTSTPAFLDSLTVENILRVAQLEIEQQKVTCVHDDANKMNKKKYSQRGLRIQKQYSSPGHWAIVLLEYARH